MKRETKHNHLNHLPLNIQIIILMVIMSFGIIMCILNIVYRSNKQMYKYQFVQYSDKVVSLELNNIEEYIAHLTNFCILPCYDTDFYNIIESKKPITQEQSQYVKDQMRSYYYSTESLKSYRIYLINQNMTIGRSVDSEIFSIQNNTNFNNNIDYQDFITSNRSYGIYPASTSNSLFTFYYAIIKIEDKSVQAVVEITVDQSFTQALKTNHDTTGEILCLLNSSNQLLYSSNSDYINSSSSFRQMLISSTHKEKQIKINGTEFIINNFVSDRYGLQIYNMMPLSIIHKQINHHLKSSILLGIALCIAASSLIFILIKLATSSLTTMSKRLETLDNGDSKTKLDLGGSLEICNLNDQFNHMLEHIDSLVKENYIHELNDRTAQLQILGLELYPHYLRKAMQDISNEASATNQIKLQRLINYLMNIISYIDSNTDFCKLGQEIATLKNMLYLQESHIDEPIRLEYDIPMHMEEYSIPKACLLVITDYLLQMNLREASDPFRIKISVLSIQPDILQITVHTFNSGMSHDYAEMLMKELEFTKNKPDSLKDNGLYNLYYRLYLLYANQASISIAAQEYQYSIITLTLPVYSESNVSPQNSL